MTNFLIKKNLGKNFGCIILISLISTSFFIGIGIDNRIRIQTELNGHNETVISRLMNNSTDNIKNSIDSFVNDVEQDKSSPSQFSSSENTHENPPPLSNDYLLKITDSETIHIAIIGPDNYSINLIRDHYLRINGTIIQTVVRGNTSDTEFTLEWLDTFDIVILLHAVHMGWTRHELLNLEDYFTKGGKVIDIGGWSGNFTYNQYLARLGIEYSQDSPFSAFYTSNFNSAEYGDLFTGVNSMYFDMSLFPFKTTDHFTPLIWDQTSSYILAGLVERIGSYVMLGSSFEYFIAEQDNSLFLDNLLSLGTHIKEGVYLPSSTVLVNTPTANISWIYHLNGTTVENVDIWVDSVYQGNTSNSWFNLSSLIEGTYNLTIKLTDNSSRTFTTSDNLKIDLTKPAIIDIWPTNGTEINVVSEFIRWVYTDPADIFTIQLFRQLPETNYYNRVYVDDYLRNSSYQIFTDRGEYNYILRLVDWCGNVLNVSITFNVHFLAAGFIASHGEHTLYQIRNMYQGSNYYTETLYSGSPFSPEWLQRFDVVFIGYGGSSWSSEELSWINNYIESGGWVVYVHRAYYSDVLLPWLESDYGLLRSNSGPGSHYTSTFVHSTPLTENVSLLYFYQADNSWQIQGDLAIPIIWSQDGSYTLGATVESMGSLIVLSGAINSDIYMADNQQLLLNIINEAAFSPNEGVALDYNSLVSNISTPTVEWIWNLINDTVDHFEVFLDSTYVGSTSNANYTLSNVTEGVHNLTVVLYSNTSNFYSHSRNLVIDFTPPVLIESNIANNSLLVSSVFDFYFNVSDNLSTYIENSVWLIGGGNITWAQLSPLYGQSWIYELHLPENGEYRLKIVLTDAAGNKGVYYINFELDIPRIGFIENHNENGLYNLKNYCNNEGYYSEVLTYGNLITNNWLQSFDVVFIGYGGFPWSSEEFETLNSYIESGGWVVYVHRADYSDVVLSWLDSDYGIVKDDSGPGNLFTSTFIHSIPLTEGVSQLYFYSTYDSWQIQGDLATPLIWSQDGFYELGAIVESMGCLIALAGDINYDLYMADNRRFISNIINEAISAPNDGIALKYSSLNTNTSTPTVEWIWNLVNASVDHFEIYLDSVYINSTLNNNFTLSNISEGVHNLTVVLYTNTSATYSHSRSLTVDFTPPIFLDSNIENNSVVSYSVFDFYFNMSDNLSTYVANTVWLFGGENSTWTKLDPLYGEDSRYELHLFVDGNYQLKIILTDSAGNKGEYILSFSVDVPRIGFIENHYEFNLYNLKNFYNNKGFYYEVLSFGSQITSFWLLQFDLVFIGEYGDNSWTTAEFDALDDYINQGGWVMCIHRASYNVQLMDWLDLRYGIVRDNNGPGDTTTSILSSTHPIVQDINQLFIDDVYNSWNLDNSEAEPLIYSSNGQYIISGILEQVGGVIVYCGDLGHSGTVYNYDNPTFWENLLNYAKSHQGSGINIAYNSLYVNTSSPEVSWYVNLDNTSIDHIEVYVDEVQVGSTNESSFQLSGLTEGTYNLTVVLYDNETYVYSDTESLLVDLTLPTVTIRDLADGAVINSSRISFVWDSDDAYSGVRQEKVYYLPPWNNTWIEIPIEPYPDPYGTTFCYINFFERGDYQIKISVWDRVGNRRDRIISVSVDYFSVGIIQTHGEDSLGVLRDYYEYNRGYSISYIYEEITIEVLMRYDIVFIGEYGNSWSIAELDALTNYINSGGWLVYVFRSSYNNDLISWLESDYGVIKHDQGPGDFTTSNFLSSHPLFNGITSFFVDDAYYSFSDQAGGIPLISTEDGEYTVGLLIEELGSLIVLNLDPYDTFYQASGQIFLENLINLAANAQTSGISIEYTGLITNSLTQRVSWNYYLENTTVDHFEIYVDDEYYTNTISSYIDFSDLTEGTFQITVILIDNSSASYSDTKYLVVDITPPTISDLNPSANEIITFSHGIVYWNVTDNISGVSSTRVYFQRPLSVTWEQLYIDMYTPNQVYIYFEMSGEYKLKFSLIDRAGNHINQTIVYTVDFIEVGIITAHGEYYLGGIRNIYQDFGYVVRYLDHPDYLTLEYFSSCDIIFIGRGGESWTVEELIALDDYVNSGGWVILSNFHPENELTQWLSGIGVGTVEYTEDDDFYTNKFLNTHPLFDGVNELVFNNVNYYLTAGQGVVELIYAPDGVTPIGAISEDLGSILVMTGELSDTYSNSSRTFILNILDIAVNRPKEGLHIKGGDRTIVDTSEYIVRWFSGIPENTTLEYFEVFLDGETLGTTPNQYFTITDLEEGNYAIKVIAHLSDSTTYEDSQMITVDLSPIVFISSYQSSSFIGLYQLYSAYSVVKVVEFHENWTLQGAEMVIVINPARGTWNENQTRSLIEYMTSGGTVIIFGPIHSAALLDHLSFYGVETVSRTRPNGNTSIIKTSHQLLANVSQLYFPTVTQMIPFSESLITLVTDDNRQYSLMSILRGNLKLLIVPCDFYSYLDMEDNLIFFENLLEWVNPPENTNLPHSDPFSQFGPFIFSLLLVGSLGVVIIFARSSILAFLRKRLG